MELKSLALREVFCRYSEADLNSCSTRRHCIAVLVTAIGLLLSGCQTLSSNPSGSGLSLSSSSLSFGSVPVGGSKSLQDVLTNNSSGSIAISAVTGSNAVLQVVGFTAPQVLAPSQALTLKIQYQPSATGNTSQTISFLGTNSQVVASISASGTGSNGGILSLNPGTLSFGNVNVGSNQKSTVTISNSGTGDLTINQATLSGAGFTLSNLLLPLTLHAGNNTSAYVTFAPTSSGTFSGSVSFVTSDAQGNVSLPLSGIGVVQGQITPNPASMIFGSVVVGNSKSLTGTLTNTGGASLTISAASANGSSFTLSGLTVPVTLSPNQSTTFSVLFSPSASGAASGSISITSNGSNPNLSISLLGTGVTPGSLSANPTSLSFGNVQVGTTSSESETVTNTGVATVTITQANVTGSGFSLSGLNLPTTLTGGGSVTFTATFSPASAGAVTGKLSLVSDATNSPLAIALSGTGTTPGTLAVSPTSLNFGSVGVGSSSSLTGTLTASSAPVTVSSASINSSEFTLSGILLPTTLAAGQSTGFTATFKPSATGTANATLTFSSNATNAPTTQSLTGTGTAPAHYVSLTWTASTSSNVVGYNVYRGTVSGGPYAIINTSLDASTAYTDNNVSAGTTYYYVVTAVDGSSNESAYSNQTTAVVPSP